MRTMRTALYSAAAAVLIFASRLARAADGFEAPKIEKAGYWPALAVAALALAGICVVAFKNTKRTHLD